MGFIIIISSVNVLVSSKACFFLFQECKNGNGRENPFSTDQLSTGQKIVGAFLSLFLILVAAYGAVFLFSLAATVISGLAIIAFFVSIYRIITKGWKSGKR